MSRSIGNAIKFFFMSLLILSIAAAIYKIFGGDLVAVFSWFASTYYSIVDSVSDFIISLF